MIDDDAAPTTNAIQLQHSTALSRRNPRRLMRAVVQVAELKAESERLYGAETQHHAHALVCIRTVFSIQEQDSENTT